MGVPVKNRRWALLVAAVLAVTLPAVMAPAVMGVAQEKKDDKQDHKDGAPKAAPDAKADAPKRVTVDRSGTFNGKRVDYTVSAGETYLRDEKGEPVASIFSVAYTRKGANPATRPVTFLYNGGPGSASLWLHMGVFGPKRVQIPADAENPGPPPFPLVDNAFSILDVTDLVFIDPVATGYSHAIGKGEEKDFLGVKEDAKSVAQFVRVWLGDNKRWNSPKFLGGESYGGIRTGAMLPELSGTTSTVSLNGIILISPAMDYTSLTFARGNLVPYWSFLPSYAATAWYHKKVADTSMGFDKFLADARQFAATEYASALILGNRLSPEQHKAVVAKLAHFTGLSPAFIEQSHLKIQDHRFMKELLRDQGKSIGRIDGRYLGEDYDSSGDRPDNDPSLNGMSGAFSAVVNTYFRNDLGLDMGGREYRVLGSLYRRWNYAQVDGGGSEPYRGTDVGPFVGDAMRQNKGMRAFVAMGYYDLATPFFHTENSFNDAGVPTNRVSFNYYPGGHMMYVQPQAIEKLTQDIRKFIVAGSPAQN
ncbi:carboxypeptidase C (cathepsin A) [Nitrospirillum viridazoti]|uniref:Carboxypeptidase C (Cathepsin A) n=1 Tax=Nitrospirillum amazonense TaxID=28077 RepID=A0A560IDG8_9PROT|nr:carboxypeptidase C (cathepsin A) [Nitrospirillum amazonense]